MGKRATIVKTVVVEAIPSDQPRLCGCGCGKRVSDWTYECFPVAPWDTPGLPPRAKADRCGVHTHCAYRSDDPARCPQCHGSANCTCAEP